MLDERVKLADFSRQINQLAVNQATETRREKRIGPDLTKITVSSEPKKAMCSEFSYFSYKKYLFAKYAPQ